MLTKYKVNALGQCLSEVLAYLLSPDKFLNLALK